MSAIKARKLYFQKYAHPFKIKKKNQLVHTALYSDSWII